MNKFLIMSIMLLCYGMMLAPWVGATPVTVTFSDEVKYWPGWGNASKDDTLDFIGIPNFIPTTKGGTAIFDGGRLKMLNFTISNWNNSLITPGDLFISTDNDTDWEYVIDITNWTWSRENVSWPSNGGYNIYSVNIPLNSQKSILTTQTDYILSGKDNSSGNTGTYKWNWSGYGIRDNHPVAAKIPFVDNPNDQTIKIGTVNFSGWGASPYFDFTTLPNNGLAVPSGMGEYITIGWAVNCANDVVYEKINTPPVPEPATMLLFGTGLLGVAGAARRFKKN